MFKCQGLNVKFMWIDSPLQAVEKNVISKINYMKLSLTIWRAKIPSLSESAKAKPLMDKPILSTFNG